MPAHNHALAEKADAAAFAKGGRLMTSVAQVFVADLKVINKGALAAKCDVLRCLSRGADAALVFPPTRGEGTMTGFRKLWDRIAKLGDLPTDVTPHVLRHSFASLAADLGYSEPTIAALVGHKGQTITSRYVHSADAVLLAAADAVAIETVARLGNSAPAAEVVRLRRA